MKINVLVILALSFFCCTISVNAQSDWKEKHDVSFVSANNLSSKFSKKEKQFIEEVYGKEAKTLVYNDADFSKSLKHLLRNRIEFIDASKNPKLKKGKLLSQVELSEDYTTQKKDYSFNLETFNPLKYKLDFFSKGTYLYIIDNTNYVIQITSQYRK
ncbi:hypothetical protein [Lacinutrix salivirga]